SPRRMRRRRSDGRSCWRWSRPGAHARARPCMCSFRREVRRRRWSHLSSTIPKGHVSMAELARQGPLDGIAPIAHVNTSGVIGPPMMRAIGRGAVTSLFGPDLPVAACRAVVDGDRAALWLGPDEWLALAPRPDETPDTTDVSHRQIALIVEGPLAATMLN